MNVETTRFGTLDVNEGELIEFRRGLFGYEEVTRFVLLNHRDDSPLRWLQAVGSPELAFVVIDPFLFRPDYRVDLTYDERRSIDWDGEGDLVLLAIVGIPENPEEMTANLKGPLVINTASRMGMQMIQPGDQWSARVRILDAIHDLHRTGNR